MSQFISFCNFVFNRIVEILDSIKFGDSPSLLKFMLAAIIIGFIIKLVKGGANDFDYGMNFTTGYVIQNAGIRYQKHKERKSQIVSQNKALDTSTTYVRLNEWQSKLLGGKSRMTLDEYNHRVNELN